MFAIFSGNRSLALFSFFLYESVWILNHRELTFRWEKVGRKNNGNGGFEPGLRIVSEGASPRNSNGIGILTWRFQHLILLLFPFFFFFFFFFFLPNLLIKLWMDSHLFSQTLLPQVMCRKKEKNKDNIHRYKVIEITPPPKNLGVRCFAPVSLFLAFSLSLTVSPNY